MSQSHTEHAQPQHGEVKKHGDPLDTEITHPDIQNTDPVPTPDPEAHSHSHAAHLADTNQKEDAYEDSVRAGSNPNVLRQPPSHQERAGRATKGS